MNRFVRVAVIFVGVYLSLTTASASGKRSKILTEAKKNSGIVLNLEKNKGSNRFCWVCNFSLGNVPLGEFYEAAGYYWQAGTNSSISIGTAVVTGDSDLELSIDNCSGQVISNGGTCTLAFKFTPSSIGSKSATIT